MKQEFNEKYIEAFDSLKFGDNADDTIEMIKNTKRPSKVKYVYFGIAAAACIIVLSIVLFNTPKSDKNIIAFETPFQSEYNIAPLPETTIPEVYTGNYQLCDVAYQVDNWIYYAYADGIYKTNTNGTENKKLNDDNAGWLQVSGDWVYYTCYGDVSEENSLVKVRLDGSERTVIGKIDAMFVKVVEDWVYYTGENDNLFRIRTDGTEKTCLVKENAFWPCIAGDWVYYSGMNCNLFKISTDGSGKTLMCDYATYLQLDGDYIYFNYAEPDPTGIGEAMIGGLCRIKTDGTDKSKIADQNDGFLGDYFAVEDNWIFYDDGEYLYKVYSDGTQKQKIFDVNQIIDSENEGSCRYPFVAGNWVYLTVDSNYTDSNTGLYRIKKDGTEAQKVNLFNKPSKEQTTKTPASPAPEASFHPSPSPSEPMGSPSPSAPIEPPTSMPTGSLTPSNPIGSPAP